MASTGLRGSEPMRAKRAGNADWTRMCIPTPVLPAGKSPTQRASKYGHGRNAFGDDRIKLRGVSLKGA